jgi:hypothetical protein
MSEIVIERIRNLGTKKIHSIDNIEPQMVIAKLAMFMRKSMLAVYLGREGKCETILTFMILHYPPI